MLSKALGSIAGVGIFPIFALLLFLAVFIGIVIWAIRFDQETMRQIERLPLDATCPEDDNDV